MKTVKTNCKLKTLKDGELIEKGDIIEDEDGADEKGYLRYFQS